MQLPSGYKLWLRQVHRPAGAGQYGLIAVQGL
jgi:hypothetical protein